MQRSGAATRRFYAAFYQLTVRSAIPTRPCTAGASLVFRRGKSNVFKTGTPQKDLRAGSRRRLPPNFTGTIELLQDAPIKSIGERPFASMEPWELAIRHRPLNKVSVELAVPCWVMRTQNMVKNSELHEVDIILPRVPDRSTDAELRPVLLHGDPADVRAVWKTIHRLASVQVSNQQPIVAPPDTAELAELPKAKPGQWQANQRTDDQAQERHGLIRRTVSKGDSGGRVPPLNEPLNTLVSQRESPDLSKEVLTEKEAQRRAVDNLEISAEAISARRKTVHMQNNPRSDTRVRLRRFAVPKLLERQFEHPNNGSIEQVKQASGLEILRYRPMAGSRHYLQLLGTDSALERAIPMLEMIMYHTKDSAGGTPPSILDLGIAREDFRIADVTHFAWIKLPDQSIDMGTLVVAMSNIMRSSDCLMEKFSAGGVADFMLRGSEEAVGLGIIDIQHRMDKRRAREDLPSAKLEVFKTGLIRNISKVTPWTEFASLESNGEAAEASVPSRSLEEAMVPQAPADRVKNHQAEEIAASEDIKNHQAEDTAASKDKKNQPEDQPKEQTNQQLGDELRSALRHLSQPVAVITATMPKGYLGKSSPRGVTVSSFCTVTLQPEPIISFNLRVPSRTWDAIDASKRMRVFLLAASPEGAAVAHAFTLPYEQPDEPFRRVRALGAFANYRSKGTSPPALTWPKAVYAGMYADLLPDKCVRIGDHMVVVAKVMNIRQDETSALADAGALAYGMRGYRSLGGEIKPMEGEAAASKVEAVEPVKTKPAAMEETDGKGQKKDLFESFTEDFEEEDGNTANTQVSSALTGSAAQQEGQASKEIKDLGPSSPILDKDALQQVLEETETSYSTKGLPTQTANENPILAEALKAAAGAYDGTPDAATTSTTTGNPQKPDTTTGSSPAVLQKKTSSSHSQSANPRPWGFNGNSKPSSRTFSTSTRSYAQSNSTSDDLETPTPKKILKSTVEDYLCQIPTNNRLYNDLITAQREAEKLETLIANGKVPAEEIDEAKNKADAIRRRVARELAWRNAQDLRVLLDQGHVNPERAQWLETNLERGQAILLHEAKLLRAELEEGRIFRKEFDEGKAALMKDYEEFDALLKRLRDFVDEDDVGGQEDEGEVGSSSSGRP